MKYHLEMEWVDLLQLVSLNHLWSGMGEGGEGRGSSAGSYLADPTSPISSHCAVIILFNSGPVHQLSWLALLRVNEYTSNFSDWKNTQKALHEIEYMQPINTRA